MIESLKTKVRSMTEALPFYDTIRRNKKRKIRMRREARLQRLIDSGLPVEMKPALDFLIGSKRDQEAEAIAQEIEKRREEIASEGSKEIDTSFSPRLKNTGNNENSGTTSKPGKTHRRTMEKIAATGKNRRWGTVLHLLAKSFKSTTVFELGACAGISACYLSTAPGVKKLITVEGSENLAKIAEESLARFSDKAKVVNGLFEDAIDSELPLPERKIDYAYIDGHHEKNATIHYFDKLLPHLTESALVVFDDISWSYDMREAWDILRKRQELSHAMDLGVIGVCILKDNAQDKSAPENWNLQPVVGKRRIHTPPDRTKKMG
jgi:predicted O-methyltransferase YrrM